MEPKIFIAMVAQMRLAQKQYLRTRTTEALDKSKIFERMVDGAIREMENNQIKMF